MRTTWPDSVESPRRPLPDKQQRERWPFLFANVNVKLHFSHRGRLLAEKILDPGNGSHDALRTAASGHLFHSREHLLDDLCLETVVFEGPDFGRDDLSGKDVDKLRVCHVFTNARKSWKKKVLKKKGIYHSHTHTIYTEPKHVAKIETEKAEDAREMEEFRR